MEMNSEIAECVGLWLAEGDNKTTAEITFTNNCLELVLFFQRVIEKTYIGENKPRLYIYSPTHKQLFHSLKGYKKINFYIDERANRPYYIYRLADTKFVKVWKEFANKIKEEPKFYADILRGIFAGEGNVNHRPKNNNHRSIRISCGFRNNFIEKLLIYFKINYKYNQSHREYSIYGESLNRAKEIKISSLHPEKESKFNKMICSVKQKHYSPNYLKEEVYSKLDNIYTTKELAKIFDRDITRLQEILSELKRERKIKQIKIKDKSLWAKNNIMEKFLLSKKLNLLKTLDSVKTITEVSKNTNFGHKAIRRRLRVLKKENLVENKENRWKLTEEGKKLVLGIDEAGKKV